VTVQEQFLRGSFGSEYLKRNRVQWNLRVPFWDDIINWVEPQSVLEVGANAGWNLRAIKSIRSDIDLKGVDVNPDAIAEANAAGFDVEEMSALDVGSRWPSEFDLVATCGVLIHISPDHIHQAMDSIIAASRQYVLAVEYASKVEEEVAYRGHAERLWRRPFASMYEDKGLILIEKGDAGNGFDRCEYALMRKP
jgi:pseudaminic acid biosynthesis-associated methylase